MTEQVYPTLPKGVLDLEHAKFTLDNDGKVAVRIVTSSGGGLTALGSTPITPVPVVTTEAIVAKITLTAGKAYKGLEVFLSCSRDCIARVVAVDDVGVTDVETVVLPGIYLGPGQNTYSELFDKIGQFTAGSTGVQELQLLATVLRPPTGNPVYAALGINEVQ